MAGTAGQAVLDFAGGVFSAQLQALRHERILRTRGSIDFLNGKRLEWNGRRITRLSTSLLELGALQDRMVLWQLYRTLLKSHISVDAGHPKMRDFNDLNDALNDFRNETGLMQKAAYPVDEHSLAGSLSAGQLAVFLEGLSSLDELVRRLTFRTTFMSLNPVFELYQARKRGLLP
jgi:hypothetical protein